jgi:hypothetical protein
MAVPAIKCNRGRSRSLVCSTVAIRRIGMIMRICTACIAPCLSYGPQPQASVAEQIAHALKHERG